MFDIICVGAVFYFEGRTKLQVFEYKVLGSGRYLDNYAGKQNENLLIMQSAEFRNLYTSAYF
jgi:hypothetical protein